MNNADRKINDKELKLIYLVGGLLILFLVYRLAVVSLQKHNDSLDEEIGQLSDQVAMMHQMQADEQNYVDQTAAMNSDIDRILQKIPAGILSQDKIMFARSLETTYGLTVTGVGLESDTLLYTMNEDSTNPEDDGKELYRTSVILDCEGDYEQIKACLRGIQAGSEMLSVGEASFTMNEETGKLSGTLTLYMFYLLGSDKVYEPVSIDGVSIGTDNIFGSFSGGSVQTGEGGDTDESGADNGGEAAAE